MRVYQFRHVGNEEQDYKVIPHKVNEYALRIVTADTLRNLLAQNEYSWFSKARYFVGNPINCTSVFKHHF